jgi:LmbE family N-acetylglucosaminyl deacetylase
MALRRQECGASGGRLNFSKWARTTVAGLLLLCSAPAFSQFAPPPGTGPGLNETIEAIQSAGVATRILYVTAHPDDESSAVLTYLARGLHAEVALLSLTRGEGGQNALGPEQAPQLGAIRTQELLAATRGYGVKLYFTSAKDFGFSKTPEEAQRMWGDQVLADMVRVIRAFKPNVVINNFGGVHSGHGHHQAAGLWTPKAVELAADPSYGKSSDPSRGMAPPADVQSDMAHEDFDRPWGNSAHPIPVLDIDRGGAGGIALPLDEVSPLWGKTWREIGIDAFANHRTQGISAFLGSSFLRRPISLVPENGAKVEIAALAKPLHALAGDATSDAPDSSCANGAFFCPVLRQAEDDLAKARQAALNLEWQKASASLAAAAQKITSLYPGGSHAAHWVAGDPHLAELHLAQRRVDRALTLAAGLEIVAEADRSEVVAGEAFDVNAESRCRKEAQCELGKLQLLVRGNAAVTPDSSAAGKNQKFSVNLREAMTPPDILEQQYPEAPVLVTAKQDVSVAGYSFAATQPVTHIAATSTRIDRVAVRLVPAYTLALEPDEAVMLLQQKHKPLDVFVRVHSYSSKGANVTVGLEPPEGWTTSSPVVLQFSGVGDQFAKISTVPLKQLAERTYPVNAYAKRGDEKFTTTLTPLPSLPTLLWSEPARCRVFSFAANVPENLRIGYISAEGEPEPAALERVGIHVDMLDAAAVAFGDLSRFDAIVVGVRAYELRSELAGANQRLLDYVSNGGTLVVQYQRDFAWDKFQYAPYPAKITPEKANAPLPRITDENSPVKFLKPDDPLLNRPNKITQEDFRGWIQERGLYFWSVYDSKYTPLLAMNDPGEVDLDGGLVYTHYGKGTYIYTGLAFFRQLPEGVPGAYRLLINLLSASRESGKTSASTSD